MTNLTNAVITGHYARSPFTFALKNGNSVTAY
jgi:hypothetical protein